MALADAARCRDWRVVRRRSVVRVIAGGFVRSPASALLVLLLATALVSPAEALTQRRVGSVPLPTSARPASFADVDEGTILVGTLKRSRFDELFAIDAGSDGRSPTVAWSLDVGARVNGIAVDGARAYLATGDDTAELLVVDLGSRTPVASFDVPGRADGLSVAVVEPGIVELVVRRNAGPERYRLSVTADAADLLAAVEDPTAGQTSRPPSLRRYRPRGRLIGRLRREVPGGVLHYLLTTERGAPFQVVEEISPLGFRDVDGDGVYRLGCVGDSNTSLLAGFTKWCEIIRNTLSDPDFAVINVAENGATVNLNLRFTSDATMQMADVLQRSPDVLILAFGTNDIFQGRTPQQIHDRYVEQQAAADAAGVPLFVATTPPIIGCPNCVSRIAAGNDLLRTTFAGRVIEFHTGFAAEHFIQDGYHCNDLGQQLRAERALQVLGR